MSRKSLNLSQQLCWSYRLYRCLPFHAFPHPARLPYVQILYLERVDSHVSHANFQSLRRQAFHTTPIRLKGKGAPKRSVQIASQRSEAAGDDPFDFAALNKSLAEAKDRLHNTLRQISPGGQINQETIEMVRVKLTGGAVVPLSNLGQVVPRAGRTIAILIGQPEHMKNVSSAILTQLEVNPTPSGQNPQELHLTIPAPTQDSRKLAQKQVVEAGEKSSAALRNSRTAQQKRLRAMEISKRVHGDDLRKAGKEMDKIMDAATADAKKTIDAAKKAMER